MFQLCTDAKRQEVFLLKAGIIIGLGEIRVLKTRSQQGINFKTSVTVQNYAHLKILNSNTVCATENRHLDNSERLTINAPK